MSKQPGHFYEFGSFFLDARERLLIQDGKPVPLASKTFEALFVLVRNAGRLVEKEDLLRQLWPGTFVEEANLAKHISLLRKALGERGQGQEYIETVPKYGYRFVAPVLERDGMPSVAEVPPVSESPRKFNSEFIAPARTHVPALAVAAALAVLIGLIIRPVRDRLLGRSSAPPIRALAVLPLENLSADPEQDFFADGMTEELTTDLGKISALRVISRTSVIQFKGTRKTLSEIGRELGVDAVIEGTVTRSGNHVRITANLVQVSPERHLWAESYESDLEDILVLQEKLAQSIAATIRVKLTPEEQTRLAAVRPVDTEAYQAYLKGQYFLAKFMPDDERKALAYFQKAVEKDPTFVLAYVGISSTYQILGNFEVVLPKVAYPQGNLAIAKALEIDPHSGEAHASQAWRLLYYDWDFNASEKEFKYALELNPNAATTHQGYANYFAALGQFPESEAEMKRALNLDPLSHEMMADFCRFLYYARRYDDALTQCKAALEIDPNDVDALAITGDLYAAVGKDSEAHKVYAKAETLLGENPATIAAMDRAFVKFGMRGEAQTWIELNKKQIEDGISSPIDAAWLYSACGRKDQAFAWLEKAFERRSYEMIFLAVNPRWDPLRSDPRFADLLRRIGLPQLSVS
jgi:TolB-like protein/DNA-binding winged helix-turn-helix (wHTH) protein/Flp pilus assembly protein TadD